MVCLSSGEFELMALAGGACENRNERPMEQVVQMLTWDDCAVYGQLSSSEIRETARVRVDALATWTRRSILCRPGRWKLDNVS